MKATIVFLAVTLFPLTVVSAHSQATLIIRNQPQELHIYGTRGAEPLIVSSGDGGWVHLAPQVAEILSAQGYFVVGFDCKHYLSSFTRGETTLSQGDVPGDYLVLTQFASREGTNRPIFVGVSEGAGLSVLAATEPEIKKAVRGVVALGLPDVTELGWRWRDSMIYLTKKAPNEPSFHVGDIVQNVAPLPLAAIHSTHDEFVPLTVVQALLEHALEPKKLWTVEASNHRFSGNEAEFRQRLMEAIDWVKKQAPAEQ